MLKNSAHLSNKMVAEYNDLLRKDGFFKAAFAKFKTMCKEGVFGSSGGDTSFEAAFGNLARVNLRERAPKLLPYEVGFQLLDRSPDDTKAAGMFAFKMSDAWLYAPIFFLNGNLKGDELLFLKSQDIFVPLKDDWIDFVLGRKPVNMGKSVDRDLQNQGIQPPKLKNIVRPMNRKYSSVAPELTGLGRKISAEFAKLAYEMPDLRVPSLPDFLLKVGERVPRVATVFLSWCRHQPQFVQKVREFYSDDIFKLSAAVQVRGEQKAQILNLEKAASVNDLELIRFNAQHPVKRGALRVYAEANTSTPLPDLSSEDKEKLISDGMLVKDQRSEDETSKAYKQVGPRALSNPNGNGVYSVVLKPGKFVKALVLTALRRDGKSSPYILLVLLDENKGKSILTSNNKVWTIAKYDHDEFKKVIDDLPEASSTSKTENDDDDEYYSSQGTNVYIDKDYNATVPLSVGKAMGGEGGSRVYEVRFNDSPQSVDRHFGAAKDLPYSSDGYDTRTRSDCCDQTLVLTAKNTGIRTTKWGIEVPENAKKLSVELDNYGDTMKNLGAWADLELEIMNKTSGLVVSKNTVNDIIIGKKKVRTKSAAVKELMEGHGLDLETTNNILDELTLQGQQYRVKYAFGFPNEPGPTAPVPDLQPDRGFEPLLGNTEVQYGREQEYPIQGTESRDAPRPDPQAVQEAMQAAQSGSSEIFDSSVFKGLIKAVREDDYVEEFVGDLIKAMDRLGRLLMLFYWHAEDFEERYGRTDLPELEDTLKNTFESTGDLVLKLRQRSVKSYSDSMGLDLAQSANN